MAFPTDWGRRCELTISSSYVDGTSHSNVPVLFTEDNLPSEMLDADGSNPALSGGGDIRFSSDESGSTRLACDVVSFSIDNDPANGKAEIWVLVPTLSGSTGATLYVWYDKSGESQPAADAAYGSEAVWVGAELAVLMEDTTPIDRSGNHTLTLDGSPTGLDGPYGKALNFIGNYRLSNSDASLRDILSSYDTTVDVVSKRSTSDSVAVLSWEGTDDFVFYPIENAGIRVFWRDIGGNILTKTNCVSTSVWQWVSFTTRASNDHEIYANGVSQATSSGTGTAGPFTTFYIGGYGDVLQDFDGDIAQVIVWKAARSDELTSTAVNNQSDPGAFASAGTPEDPAGGGAAYDETFAASATSAVTLTDAWSLNYSETYSTSAAASLALSESYATGYAETYTASAPAALALTDAWLLDFAETYGANASGDLALTDGWSLDYSEAYAVGAAADLALADAWALDYAETLTVTATGDLALSNAYAVGNNYNETFSVTGVAELSLTDVWAPHYGETLAADATAALALTDTWQLDYAETLAASAAAELLLADAYDSPAPGAYDETFSASAIAALDLTHLFTTPNALPPGINHLTAMRVGGFFAVKL